MGARAKASRNQREVQKASTYAHIQRKPDYRINQKTSGIQP